MSRPLRIALEDGWYHVINRGIERRSIFRSATDYHHFVELLAQLPERFGILTHCYALMPNHYHHAGAFIEAMFRAARLRAGFAPKVCSPTLPVRPASGVNALTSVLLSNQSGREHSILFSIESWSAWLTAALRGSPARINSRPTMHLD